MNTFNLEACPVGLAFFIFKQKTIEYLLTCVNRKGMKTITCNYFVKIIDYVIYFALIYCSNYLFAHRKKAYLCILRKEQVIC